MLKFGKGNAKLDGYKKPIHTFSLPAGFTCPGAKDCKSRAVIVNGKRQIKDGPDTVFRCFAASQEVVYTNTYNARKHNFDLLRVCKDTNEMAKLISDSLPKRAQIVRIHVSGDFFSQRYFDAWVKVATENPSVIFYAYTKSIPYVIARKGTIPENFRITASFGGHHDMLIPASGLRTALVVYTVAQASGLGLDIDSDDSHAIGTGGDFALLLHGTQPKGSEASKALVQLKKAGKGGYSK
jgi:hypothetical protein